MTRKLFDNGKFLRGKVVEVVQIEEAVFDKFRLGNRRNKHFQFVCTVRKTPVGVLQICLVQQGDIGGFCTYAAWQIVAKQPFGRHATVLHRADYVVHVGHETRSIRALCKALHFVGIVGNDT